jgi:hypothetical protein
MPGELFFSPVRLSKKIKIPLFWREGMKGRGDSWLDEFCQFFTLPPASPVKGERAYSSF